MKALKLLILLIAAAMAGYLGNYFASFETNTPSVQSESAYSRVTRTQTLRCGYNYYAPVLMRNEKTGALEGVYVDYMEALGKITGLKIEWTSEIGWGDVPIALKDKKIDAFCAGTWADGRRGAQIAYTMPVFYNLIEVYGRPDDHRFDQSLDSINDPNITIATIEGGISSDIATQEFPAAKVLRLPAMESDAEQLLNVASGKADVTFTSQGPAALFLRNNPGKLQRLPSSRPLRVFGVTTAIVIDDPPLLNLLNAATQQLLDGGMIDRILAKYEKDYPNSFNRVVKHYEANH
jgi:ABC-type amino acid transport substrate-binding protein